MSWLKTCVMLSWRMRTQWKERLTERAQYETTPTLSLRSIQVIGKLLLFFFNYPVIPPHFFSLYIVCQSLPVQPLLFSSWSMPVVPQIPSLLLPLHTSLQDIYFASVQTCFNDCLSDEMSKPLGSLLLTIFQKLSHVQCVGFTEVSGMP